MKEFFQPRRRLRSLRARFSLILGGFSLILALVVSGVVGEFSERRERQTIVSAMEETASEVSQRFGTVLVHRVAALTTLASQLGAAKDGAALRRDAMEASMISATDHAWMAFAAPSGTIRISTNRSSEGGSLRGQPMFEAAHERVYLASYPVTKGISPLLEIGVPVFDENHQPAGVLCARFDWDWLRRTGENVIGPLRTRWQLQVLLMDRNGMVLVAPGAPSLQGATLPMKEISAATASGGYIWSFAEESAISKELRTAGWVLLARQPESISAEAASDLRWQIMAGGLGCGLLFALVGWFVSARAARPLAQIAEAAAEIARGESRSVLPLPGDDDEIVSLVGALNGLLKTREEQTEALRQGEARLRLATEAAGIGIWTWDLSRDRVACSPECASIFGCGELFATSRAFLRLVHRGDRRRIWQAVRKSLSEREAYDCEFRIMKADGGICWVASRGRAEYGGHGEPERFLGVVADITESKQAGQALRDSEERSRSLFENNIDGIFSLDLNGYFTDANPAALRLSDYTLEELRRKKFTDLCAPDKLSEAVEVFRQVAAGGTAPIETAMIDRHGVRRELIVHGTPMLLQGKLAGIFGVVADITAKKRAEEALKDREQMLSAAIDAAQMGTWDWNVETNEVQWSDRSRGIFGVPLGIRFSFEDFYARIHPDDRSDIAARVQRALGGEAHYEAQYRLLMPDGSIRWVSSVGRLLSSQPAGRKRLVGVLLDVTPLVKAAQDLSTAKEVAEAASRAKDDFLAALSHELRTPLNPVLMLASELAESPDLSPRVRSDFAMIRKNVALEARLIDDLLDLTRITRGKLLLQLQQADVHTLLYQSFEMLRADAENKQLVISFDLSAPERTVNGDPVRLQQVFWNVIKNAVKFTPPGGSITLRTRQGSNRAILVEITDTGMGIEPEEMPRIFDAFAQGAQAGGHRFGGLGLGLSISKLLVQLHHGRINASSQGAGHGSVFRIDLPLADEEAAAVPLQPAPEPARTVHALRILLIEDHEPTRATLSRLLSKRGHLVSAAETVATARALAAAAEFDFVVSDIGLPDGNGQDLMAELRDTYGLAGIALSGYGREEDVRRSLECGFIAHLVKPVDVHALETAMRNAGSAESRTRMRLGAPGS